MATKQGPLNQHEYLHPYYGIHNCCLCKEEAKVAKYKAVLRTLDELLKKQENLDPKITKLVDETFWELV